MARAHGSRWAICPQGVPVALAVDPVTPSTWYAAGSVAIYKSTDAGATWRAVRKITGCEVYPFVCYNAAIVINPVQPSTIYVPISSAIYKTTDGGENWTTLPTLPGNVTTPTYLTLDPANPDHLFAVAFNYNFRSFDGGQSWIQFFPPAKNPGNACGAGVAFDPVRANVAYFVDHCELFRSSDSGLTWSSLSTPFPLASQVFAVAKSGLLYVTAYDGIYSSDDGGATWTLVLPVTGASQGEVRIMAIDPASGGIYTGNSLNLGRNVISVVFDPARPGHAIALTQGATTSFIARLDYSGTVLDATYLGGQGTTNIVAMALDAAGNIYIAGTSSSPDFPVTTATPRGSANWFIASLDASLAPRYATWVPDIDMITSIAADSGGRSVIGGTAPPNPTAQWQCVAIKLTPDGSDTVFRAAIDGSVNNCVAASDAADNTILAGSGFQGAAVSKLDPAGNLLFTTSLGNHRSTMANAVAVDSSSNIYVAGNTAVVDTSTGIPGTCPYPSSAAETGIIGTITSYQTDDAFVTRLDPGGSVLATKLIGGNCYDVARGISLGPDGSVWITGVTQSSPFPQAMPFESGPPFADYKAFVAMLDPALTSLQLSSYISAGQQPSVAADVFGNAYVGGTGTPPQSPYRGPPAPPKYVTGVQATLAKIQSPAPAAPHHHQCRQCVHTARRAGVGGADHGDQRGGTGAGIAGGSDTDAGRSPAPHAGGRASAVRRCGRCARIGGHGSRGGTRAVLARGQAADQHPGGIQRCTLRAPARRRAARPVVSEPRWLGRGTGICNQS